MKTPTLYNEDGSETVLPFEWHICSACNGRGKSSAYLGAYTADEMHEAGPDFYEEYMAGGYDRICDECDGAGKVKRVAWSKLTKAQKREYREQVAAEREMRAIEAAERRMGA
jgi:hypothetical protein